MEKEEFEGKMNFEGGGLGCGGDGKGLAVGVEVVGRKMHSSSWMRARGRVWCTSMIV